MNQNNVSTENKNGHTPPSTEQIAVKIQNDQNEKYANEITAEESIAEEITTLFEPLILNTTDNRRNKYLVMCIEGQTCPLQKNLPPEPRSCWFPMSYFPSCGSPAPPTSRLNYKPETLNPFVKLVLTIVLIMIFATAMFVGLVLMTPDVKNLFRRSCWTILLPAIILIITVDYAMMCLPRTRQPPCNVMFLFLAVASMSVISAKITAHFRTELVLCTIISTGAVVFVCVLLACTSFDFTRFILYVIVISTALSVVLIVKIAIGAMMRPVALAVLAISTLVQSVLLTIQLQMILRGKIVELTEPDYALGAFMIYTSLITIFLRMAQIIGISKVVLR